MEKSTLNEKVKAAKEIVKTFTIERFMFAVAASITVATSLFLLIYYSLFKEGTDFASIMAFLTPTGGVVACTALILRMFEKCLAFIKEVE